MDDLKQFALEDELDDLIEHAATSMDDGIYITGGDLSESQQEENEFVSDTAFDDLDSQYPYTSPEHPAGVIYQTVENVFSGGATTYGSDGSTYQTVENVLLEGTTTYGSDGITYRTVKNVFSEGTTTYGSDGTTYQTVKKVLDQGSVTYGSDGSKFETSLDVFGGQAKHLGSFTTSD